MRVKVKKISGDASFRKFFLTEKESKKTVIVYADKEKFKNLITYAAINNFLRKNGIKTPKTISNHYKKNFIEIEYLGSNSLVHQIQSRRNILKSYKKLIEILAKFQRIKIIKSLKYKSFKIFIQDYNVNKLHAESDLFFEWYLPYFFSRKKSNQIKRILRKELDKLYRSLNFKNKVMVHRDFHASNVMIYKNNYYLIDSQDLIIGNPLYDLVSLVDDVRVKTSLQIKNQLIKYSYKFYKKRMSYSEYLKNFHILSLQRNLKILGIFTRLFVRDGKPDYFNFMPNTWNLIALRLRNPYLKTIASLLNKFVNEKTRRIKSHHETK